MKLFEKTHNSLVFQRRVQVLSNWLSRQLPENATVLDVGCGDGLIASQIQQLRPDVTIQGIDVLARKKSHIPVTLFDGNTFPFLENAFDVVMFVDVLHHTESPHRLLKEAKRVARDQLLIKDHCQNGMLDRKTLLFMDWVGNIHQGVALPYNYWSEKQWKTVMAALRLEINNWRHELGIYPWPATLLFDRSLHFIASLGVSRQKSTDGSQNW